MPKTKAKFAKARSLKAYRAEWRKSGRCTQCGNPKRAPGKLRCQGCLDKARPKDRKVGARKRGAWKKLGLCRRCGAEPVPGLTLCAKHLEDGAVYGARYTEREKTRRPSSVYVAGAFSAPREAGVLRNMSLALEAGAILVRMGHRVIVPHVAVPAHLPWKGAMQRCKALLASCWAVVLMPGWELSRGARQERVWAEEMGIPVFHLADVAPESAPALHPLLQEAV